MKMEKLCKKCNISKHIEDFTSNKGRRDGLNYWCRECQGIYLKKWKRDCRLKIINHYGGKCICCGEEEYKFLSIDHINGGGNKHKQEVGRSNSFLRWIIKNNYPNFLQILCHNCNQAKGAWGKCPHENATIE